MNKQLQKEPGGMMEITKFGGRLTRTRNGLIDSGLAKFDTSWGYNPFVKPGQLTWGKAPSIFYNNADGLVLSSVSRVESNVLQTYVITNAGKIIKFSGAGFSSSTIATLSSGSPTYTYGASIQFYGATDTLYIAHDKGVTKIKTDGSGETQIGTWDATHFTPITTKRSMIQFQGLLYVTNSDASVTYANNIAEISLGGAVNSYAKLSPSFPVGTYIRDLDISPDLTYMLISASYLPSELIAPVNDGVNSASGSSNLYRWNGTDVGVTNGVALPSFSTTALQSFGNSQYMFMYDTFGASLFENGKKTITLRNNKSPFPDAVCSTGNFLSWTCPETPYNLDAATYSMVGSMYYYGSMDDSTPSGLWRMFRQTSASGVIYQVPWNQFSSNRYVSSNTTPTVSEITNGTHLLSLIDYTGSGGSTLNKYYAFDVSPSDTFTGPMLGVYETQNQLFGKRISLSEMRIYCEPTIANNGFQIDLIGSDGKIVTNGTFNYTYAAGTDITLAQGPLERITFNTNLKNLYSVGVRITNTGTTNMTFNKVEIDWEYSGR